MPLCIKKKTQSLDSDDNSKNIYIIDNSIYRDLKRSSYDNLKALELIEIIEHKLSNTLEIRCNTELMIKQIISISQNLSIEVWKMLEANQSYAMRRHTRSHDIHC